MLSLIESVSGRPWMVRGELAAHVRGLVAKEGIAGLRHLAELRAGLGADRPQAARSGQMATSSTVAVVPIIGLLTQRGGMDPVTCEGFRSTAAIADEVMAAASDPKVDAVVLECDSNGGEVYGIPEAWQAIRDAAKLKPIICSVNSVSASAAYYLATACTEAIVTPSGCVGSVGVYMLHVDISKALEDMGERWTFISAGKFKVEGNPAEPLSDAAREALQIEVDRYYSMFVRDVAKGRRVSTKRVIDGFGEGRMVGALAAVEAGMADSVGTLSQAIQRAAKLGQEQRKAGGPAARSVLVTGCPEADTLTASIMERVGTEVGERMLRAEQDEDREQERLILYGDPSAKPPAGVLYDPTVTQPEPPQATQPTPDGSAADAARRDALARLGAL